MSRLIQILNMNRSVHSKGLRKPQKKGLKIQPVLITKVTIPSCKM